MAEQKKIWPASGNPAPRTWRVADLGRVDYRRAWALQLALVEARRRGGLPQDTVLMLEHPPVFTLGRSGGREFLQVPESVLAQAGIPLVQVERGGKITYHGPGQLVVYPIVDLEALGLGVADFVGALEEVMIRTCADWGVAAGRSPANRGAWVGPKKIGSIGIALRRGISYHGLALNVEIDLAPFCWVSPCGLEGVRMTSLRQEVDKPVPMAQVKASMQRHIAQVFDAQLAPAAPEDLPQPGQDAREQDTTPAR